MCEYKMNIEKLCGILRLGHIKESPVQVSGGYMHRMYSVKTTSGHYAVKALNPQILLKDDAVSDFIFSEKVARIAAESGVDALPAMIFDGKNIHEVDRQYYLVFKWFDGKAISSDTIDIDKCRVIGELLAKIHNSDFSSVYEKNRDSFYAHLIDWEKYLIEARKHKTFWLEMFSECIDMLFELDKKSTEASRRLSKNTVISHMDLDQKNVLWDKNGMPIIIDWESAGYINPSADLLDVALYWSGGEDDFPDEQAFNALLNSYKNNANSKLNDDMEDVLKSVFFNRLRWLEHVLNNSFEANKYDEVCDILTTLKRYRKALPSIYKWLDD